MKYIKILIIVFLLMVLTGCNKTEQKGSETSKIKPNEEGITAIKAWQKIKPEADKWNSSYKIASINDISTPSVQRIDGRSIGWKFYLEDCQEYYTGSLSNLCKTGRSRSFYYHAQDMVGQSSGVSADKETQKTSGRSTFPIDKFKIDSDKAQDIAREKMSRQRNENEEFKMAAYFKNDIAYWQVIRQCWTKGNRENCDSQNGYSVYVNLETGEAYDKEPK